jgi:hypothetical protein
MLPNSRWSPISHVIVLTDTVLGVIKAKWGHNREDANPIRLSLKRRDMETEKAMGRQREKTATY